MLVLGLCSVAVIPAEASSAVTRDPRGDARASLDIVNTKVTLNDKRMRLRVKVRDLGTSGAFTLSLYQDTEDFDTSSLHLTGYKTRGAAAASTVGSYDRLGISGPNPSTYHYDEGCPSSVTWSRKRDQVVVVLPGCGVGFDESKPVHVKVLATRTLADADHERRVVDATRQTAIRL